MLLENLKDNDLFKWQGCIWRLIDNSGIRAIVEKDLVQYELSKKIKVELIKNNYERKY